MIARLRRAACTSPGRIPKDEPDPEWRKQRPEPQFPRRLTAPVAFICPVRRQVRFPLPTSRTMGQPASLGRITGPAGMPPPFGHARQPPTLHPPRGLRTACGPFFRAPAWLGRTSATAAVHRSRSHVHAPSRSDHANGVRIDFSPSDRSRFPTPAQVPRPHRHHGNTAPEFRIPTSEGAPETARCEWPARRQPKRPRASPPTGSDAEKPCA